MWLGEGAQGRGLGEGAQEEAGGGGEPMGGACTRWGMQQQGGVACECHLRTLPLCGSMFMCPACMGRGNTDGACGNGGGGMWKQEGGQIRHGKMLPHIQHDTQRCVVYTLFFSYFNLFLIMVFTLWK